MFFLKEKASGIRRVFALLIILSILLPNGVVQAKTVNVNPLANKKIEKICMNEWGGFGAVTTEGELYIWGTIYNYDSKNNVVYSYPQKVLDNVVDVQCSESIWGAITSEKNLYTWGCVYTGDGTADKYSKPKKVMSNVKKFYTKSNVSCAITNNDDLYVWGKNFAGIVDETRDNVYSPVKKLSNIKYVCTDGYVMGAVTNGKQLYMWGYNQFGTVGNGTRTQYILTPQLIMEDVSHFMTDGSTSCAVTIDNDLYFWGSRIDGGLRGGTNCDSTTPILKATGIKKAMTYGNYKSYLTVDGELYDCGGFRTFSPQLLLSDVRDYYATDGYIYYAITDKDNFYLWGTVNGYSEPELVFENVKEVCTYNNRIMLLTNDGDLYIWNGKIFGEERKEPFKINANYFIDDGSAEDETDPAPEKPSGVSVFDQNIVNNIDISEYTQGVNLGKDTIHGPTLNIMGKEIELFSIDANVKLEIADEVTYKINAEDKTIEVLVGVESRDGKVDFSDDANSDSDWSKTYSQVKSLYQGITKEKSTKNLYNQFRSLRNKLHSTNSTLLINGDVKSVLFLKFSYETGKIELMQGGGIVSAELGADWEKRIPQVPLAYVAVGAKASGELTFKVVPVWSGELGIDLALNAGVGIGEKKHAKTYIEGGTKVTLKNKLKLPAKSIAESLSVKVNGKGYLKAKVFGMLVGEISKDYVNLNLYPKFGIEKNALFLSQANLEKQLSPESVEYVTSAAIVENGREVDFEKKDLYPYCAPVLTNLGNNCYLLVWVDDMGDKDTYNRTTLMYSYYNGSQWSSPQKVAESDYLNDYPAVYGKDGVAYVVWQQTTQKCDENTTVEEMLTYSDLYCAKFENESFGTPFAITDNNEVYEMQQQVCIAGDKVYVAWVENSENDPFMGKDEINTIYMKEITNESSEKVVVSDNLETVSNVVIGEVDNRFIVAYEDGMNGYLYDGDSIQSLSDDGDKLMNLQIKDGLLYALVNDYVSEYKDGSFVSLELPLAGDYTVLSDGAHIVSNVSDGDTSKLVLYTRYDNGWNDGVALTDGTKYVRNYQIIEKENGELTSVICEVEINLETEDIYGKADLYVDNLEAENDLELLDTVYTDRENPIAGENLTLYYEVANNGANQVDELTISLAAQDGTVLQEETVNMQIQSGATAEESITVTMPDNMEKQDYILSIQSDNDQVAGNNQITVTLGYSDLSITECTIDESGAITGLLLNEGYDTAENVRVKVYKDSMDTEPVKELTYGSMTAGQQQELLVSLSKEDLVAMNGALGTTWILDVETDSIEAGYGNNTDMVFCYRPLELSLADSTATAVGKTVQLEVTDSLTGENFSDKVLWSSSDEEVVFVSDTGVIRGVKKGTAEVYAWFEDKMYTCHVIVNDTSKSEGLKQEESKTETAQPAKPKPSQKQTLPAVGTQIASSSAVYKVTKSTSSQKEVTYVKPKSKNETSVSIPDTIKISGFTYKVTSVAANALANNKKVTKITVGKNVTSIGKNAFKKCTKLKTVTLKSTSLKSIGSNAFYGDKNLKNITIKSSKLTSTSVGKNAFKGTNKKLTIKVPKKKVSSYKKFLKKKGNTKITVKKG